MATKWTTAAKGIRYREHPTRKHGVRPDRYFVIRFTSREGRKEEALGWASEGWTLDRAQKELVSLRDAYRTGEGLPTLKAKRDAAAKADAARAEAEAARLRAEKTVADLWSRYATEVAAVQNKASTVAQKARMWQTRIKPAIGALKVKDVTEEDVGAVVRAPLKLDDDGQITGGKAEAGNLYRLMHHMFSKALAWGLRPRALGNPLENVTEPKVARRERLLTGGEIGALQKTLAQVEADATERPEVVAVLRLAILTGARISELLSLRWEHVRRDDMELHLPDTKSGFSRRPLSAEAMAVIEAVPVIPGVPFVFRAVRDARGSLPYDTVEKAFRRITKAAGVENCSLHTLRHWFATMTANAVSNPRVGMALTGHKSHSAYLNYIHGDKAQARALADQLAALATGLAGADAKVAKLPASKA